LKDGFRFSTNARCASYSAAAKPLSSVMPTAIGWRGTAADHPDLVRGAVIAAAAAKQYAPELSTAVTNAGNLSLSDEERLAALRFAFFAPGNDPTVWLKGWHPEIRDSQRAAVAAVKAGRMVVGRHVAAPGFAAEKDPFKPESKRNEMKNEFGSRITVMLIPYASHAFPKAVVVSAGGSRACPDRRPAALVQLSTLN
jgi:hypothetical protein